MKANLSKALISVCLLTIQLSTFSTAFAKSGGAIAGGGGDASEERVDDIRSDIVKWINDGGAKGLQLPKEITYDEYVSRMTDILQPKKVIIEFTEEKVMVQEVEKTCRGFISVIDSKAHILCNISRFGKTLESGQYKLIHHEFAGLVNVENNEGAASDYMLSSQITDFLSQQAVLKLAIKKLIKKTVSTNNCELGAPRHLSPEAVNILDSKGYIIKNIENASLGELVLKFRRGSEDRFPSGLFCITQFVDISIVKKGEFDKLVHNERVSSCVFVSSIIPNYEKKLVKALKKMPDCKI